MKKLFTLILIVISIQQLSAQDKKVDFSEDFINSKEHVGAYQNYKKINPITIQNYNISRSLKSETLLGLVEKSSPKDIKQVVLTVKDIHRSDAAKGIYRLLLVGIIGNEQVEIPVVMTLREVRKNKDKIMKDFLLYLFDYNSLNHKYLIKGTSAFAVYHDRKGLETMGVRGGAELQDLQASFVGTISNLDNEDDKCIFNRNFYNAYAELPFCKENLKYLFKDSFEEPTQLMKEKFPQVLDYILQ
jgi:hypothetical protein